MDQTPVFFHVIAMDHCSLLWRIPLWGLEYQGMKDGDVTQVLLINIGAFDKFNLKP